MATCRACLCIDRDLFPADAHFLSSYNLLTHMNVKLCDLLPKSFCRACMESVNFYIAFRDKCITSESTLQEKIVQNIKVDECLVEIKREEDSTFNENYQYELVDLNTEDYIKKEECREIETEQLEDKERNPLELEECVKMSRGRPRKQCFTTTNLQPLKKERKEGYEYYCGLCDESFILVEDLNSHLDGHRTDDHCSKCFKTFENWPKLLAHRAIHSGQTRKKCHLCPRKFNTIYKMEQHYLHVHFEEKAKDMCCTHCQKIFTSPERYEKHLQTHIRECHICPEIFPSGHLLNLHLRTHEPDKRYQCPQCEYTAIYPDVLATHKKWRHKKFSCITCERKFADEKNLKKHTCKDKSKLCPICGQRIYGSFKRHLSSHEDVKKFKCERCPASFKSPAGLRVHLDRHENSPKHACDYCGRKFYARATLTKHRRVHTGEKPYVCKICSKCFTGNSNLKVHMKVHGIMLINKRVKDPVEGLVVGQGTSA